MTDDRVRREAAKLRVTLDRRLGRTTPEWVIALAESRESIMKITNITEDVDTITEQERARQAANWGVPAERFELAEDFGWTGRIRTDGARVEYEFTTPEGHEPIEWLAVREDGE